MSQSRPLVRRGTGLAEFAALVTTIGYHRKSMEIYVELRISPGKSTRAQFDRGPPDPTCPEAVWCDMWAALL
jgi:hypothetical protein